MKKPAKPFMPKAPAKGKGKPAFPPAPAAKGKKPFVPFGKK